MQTNFGEQRRRRYVESRFVGEDKLPFLSPSRISDTDTTFNCHFLKLLLESTCQCHCYVFSCLVCVSVSVL